MKNVKNPISLFNLISIICLLTNIHTIICEIQDWQSYQENILSKLNEIPGWCSIEKAKLISDLIKDNNFDLCVEIGVFAGKSLFPIAATLNYKKKGIVYGIDPWDTYSALEGLSSNDPSIDWWKKIDFRNMYLYTMTLLKKNRLNNYKLIKDKSSNCTNLFKEISIDFIHFDGNHNSSYILEDVTHYISKVKDKGYILLNDANWYTMKDALAFLMERCDLISPFTREEPYFLFKRNIKKEQARLSLLQ